MASIEITPKQPYGNYYDPARVERLPTAEVSERQADRVLISPTGEVLIRIVDRPFLGYGKRD